MTTCPAGGDVAESMSRELLENGLAACIQEMPIMSNYRWKGEIHRDAEVLLFIKGRAADFDRIKEAILRLHPYELPEIVSVPITAGLDRYLEWLSNP